MLLSVGISAVMWSIWNRRNDIGFERKSVLDPFVIVYRACSLINSWVILQKKQERQKELIWGAKLLERVANEVFSASRGWRPGILQRLLDGGGCFRGSWGFVPGSEKNGVRRLNIASDPAIFPFKSPTSVTLLYI